MGYLSLLLTRLAVLPLLLMSIVIHEVSHGLAAYALGDPTAKRAGRLTLNPLKHLDPFGTLLMLFAPIGFAKPVPINPYYMRRPKLGMALTALAGPISNLLLAFVGLFVYVGFYSVFGEFVRSAVAYFIMLNVTLAVFNLIPFPPLDGSKIMFSVLPERAYFGYMKYERYGIIILYILVFLGVFDRYISVVTGGIVDFFLDIITKII